ncbi:MAG: PAS domain-containing protein [Deltaproteobacteria bacterium]|nr:PAS domain-containing protein [Deltaproteobacteria bacterium]
MKKKPTYEELKKRVEALEEEKLQYEGVVEALRQSESRYQTLFENIPLGIGIGTSDGRALQANDALLRMTGYQKAELNQIKLNELYKKTEDRDMVLKQLEISGFIHGLEIQFIRKDSTFFYGSITLIPFPIENMNAHLMVMTDITEQKKIEEEREKLIFELKGAFSKINTLKGFLPICASCKKIRDDKGYWNQIESYIRDHSEAEFSHGICPECAKKLYPKLNLSNGK